MAFIELEKSSSNSDQQTSLFYSAPVAPPLWGSSGNLSAYLTSSWWSGCWTCSASSRCPPHRSFCTSSLVTKEVGHITLLFIHQNDCLSNWCQKVMTEEGTEKLGNWLLSSYRNACLLSSPMSFLRLNSLMFRLMILAAARASCSGGWSGWSSGVACQSSASNRGYFMMRWTGLIRRDPMSSKLDFPLWKKKIRRGQNQPHTNDRQL